MMTELKTKYANRLSEARTRLLGLFEKMGDRSEEQLYSDGAGWTLRQLAIHMMIADRGITQVIQQIAQGNNPIPDDYDIDRYNKRSVEKQPDVTIDQAIASLKQSRADLLAWLESVDDGVLEMEGRHPLGAVYKLAQFLNIMAAHDTQHADDIEKHLNS